jgi:hypothetical protein
MIYRAVYERKRYIPRSPQTPADAVACRRLVASSRRGSEVRYLELGEEDIQICISIGEETSTNSGSNEGETTQ